MAVLAQLIKDMGVLDRVRMDRWLGAGLSWLKALPEGLLLNLEDATLKLLALCFSHYRLYYTRECWTKEQDLVHNWVGLLEPIVISSDPLVANLASAYQTGP